MHDKVLLAHGAGGGASYDLIRKFFLTFFSNKVLQALDDAAVLSLDGSRLAFTIDAYVVYPLFFPGGNIGKLALCGTVNDLSVMGAKPLGIAVAYILEEGFPMEDLERITSSLSEMAKEVGVWVVTGDTKVVPKGTSHGLFLITSGIGLIEEGVFLSGSRAKPRDVVIVSGPIGDHEAAVILARGEFAIEGDLKSDCAPLWDLVRSILKVTKNVHVMRDPTRGGLATSLWEIAQSSKVGIVIEEESIPVRREVLALCELLGFDPYYLASEGRLIVIAPEEEAERILSAMREHPLGREGKIIGNVVEENPGRVLLKTKIGGHRLLEPLMGSQFPRIC